MRRDYGVHIMGPGPDTWRVLLPLGIRGAIDIAKRHGLDPTDLTVEITRLSADEAQWRHCWAGVYVLEGAA